MEDSRLRCFVTVAQERSFTKAARRLGVTQSAVSQSIIELENELGTRLFERGRGIDLTLSSDGMVLMDYAEKILGWYSAATELFVKVPGTRQLRVCVSDDVAASLLSPVLASMGEISFDVVSPADGGPAPDVTVRLSSNPPDLETSANLLAVIPLELAASAENRSAMKGSLEGCRLALWAPAAACLDMKLKSMVAVRSSSSSLVMDLAESSAETVAVVPAPALRRRLETGGGRLAAVIAGGALPGMNLYCEPSVPLTGTALWRRFRSRLEESLKY
ncbi:MAG: LysR family transcriptional regulator [Bacteroidales bacterium]|nr:LysR family transcriptional regulator [Bacteroidales bacterium]